MQERPSRQAITPGGIVTHTAICYSPNVDTDLSAECRSYKLPAVAYPSPPAPYNPAAMLESSPAGTSLPGYPLSAQKSTHLSVVVNMHSGFPEWDFPDRKTCFNKQATININGSVPGLWHDLWDKKPEAYCCAKPVPDRRGLACTAVSFFAHVYEGELDNSDTGTPGLFTDAKQYCRKFWHYHLLLIPVWKNRTVLLD